MRLHRHPLVLRAWTLAPHQVVHAAVRRLARLERPRPVVQAVIRAWVERGGIDLTEARGAPFPSVQAFFLRDLSPGARPLAEGLIAPVDGRVVAAGLVHPDQTLWIKGKPVSLGRLLNGRQHRLDLDSYGGGFQVTIFLTPDGYHHVHAPEAGVLEEARWIPGRYFPQNDDALRVLPRVYERNERATLSLRLPDGRPWLLSMVAASLVGGLHLDGVPRAQWIGPRVTPIGRSLQKGDRIGHFSLGSTVVLVFPAGVVRRALVEPGQSVKLGEGLLELT